jgi:transglutaminase-like putative cysteine protease
MTATLRPGGSGSANGNRDGERTGDPAAPSPRAGAGSSGGGRPSVQPPASPVAAEVALCVLSLVSFAAFWRVFAGWAFLADVTIAAVGAHLWSALARRWRTGMAVALGGGVALGAVVVTALRYPATATFGVVPSWATLDVAETDLRAAVEVFSTIKPLVPAEGGFLLMATVAAWVLPLVADAFAFRARATVEAILPAGLAFAFTAALAADRGRLAAAMAFGAAALGFAATHRAWRLERDARAWFGGRRRGARADLLARAAVLVVVAGTVGTVVGARLPGSSGEPVIDLTEGGRDRTRVRLSPLVNIQGRLSEQSTVEAFRVRSPEPAYWRLTALDTFDGIIWRASTRPRDVGSGALPGADTVIPGRRVTQQVTITGLDNVWLPAASAPVVVRGGTRLQFDRRTDTLLTEDESAIGQTYTVESVLPEVSAAELRLAGTAYPTAVTDVALALPDGFAERFGAEVREAVAGAEATPYALARALQDWFRTTFTYELGVSYPGQSEDAIAAFLEARVGYCEHFAGTFAAFARTLGIPSRVAVGFTPGEAVDAGTWRVLGRHAHAWPEVYFPGHGWVAFEPTPGRGAPGASAQDVTGVPPQQDGAPPVVTTTTTTATTVVSASTTIDPALTLPVFDLDDGSGVPLPDTIEDGDSTVVVQVVAVAGVVAAAIAAWAGLVQLWRGVRRRRHLRRAAGPAGRIGVHWDDAVAQLDTRVRPTPGETPVEFAGRARTVTAAAHALVPLADVVTRAAYAPVEPDATEEAAAAAAARHVAVAVAQRRSRAERLRRLLDPRLR